MHVVATLNHCAIREIAEALGVAVALNARTALVYSARMMGVVDNRGRPIIGFDAS